VAPKGSQSPRRRPAAAREARKGPPDRADLWWGRARRRPLVSELPKVKQALYGYAQAKAQSFDAI
jgi:hypothetical protein